MNLSRNSEEDVFATVTLRSQTGKSLFRKENEKVKDTRDFRPSSEAFIDVKKVFEKMGFKIRAQGKFSLTISSPRKHFEEIFRVQLQQQEHPVFIGKKEPLAKYYVLDREIEVPKELTDLVERISLPPKASYFQSPEAPTPDYHHIDVPEMISCFMRSAGPHSHGWTGDGINVVMIDSGFFDFPNNHPYYQNKNYNINVNAVVGNVGDDEYGHGTGIAACLFAVAPDINFTMVKIATNGALHVLPGFQTARGLNPDVITCSWGAAYDDTLETEIEDAVNDGITVIFACGNDGPIGWPGEMPDVISIGGAYVDETHCNWEASSYASSGSSARYKNRNIPDVCGIVGQAPLGILIPMPTEPNSSYDLLLGGGVFPNSDETPTNDGWLVASGTSSAAPMVAGVAALMLQKNSNLSPNTIKTILEVTARDITTGTSASGDNAVVGVDDATGYGLVDAKEALEACFIATAAYGSKLAPKVQFLRSFRNAWINSSGLGKGLVDKIEQKYYIHSPKIAKAMRYNSGLKLLVRWTIVAPLVRVLRFFVGMANIRSSLQRKKRGGV